MDRCHVTITFRRLSDNPEIEKLLSKYDEMVTLING